MTNWSVQITNTFVIKLNCYTTHGTKQNKTTKKLKKKVVILILIYTNICIIS